jgi:hypothetical protein
MSDIDAFEAVIAARTRGLPDGAGSPVEVGVTVAVHGASLPAPAELQALADLHVGGAHEVGRLLSALARRSELVEA